MDALTYCQSILAKQPFSGLMGLRMNRFEDGHAECELDITKELSQQHGFAHGGVVATLADTALAFAGGSRLGNIVTAEFKLSYLRPAVGERLLARADVIYSSKNQASVRCDIFAIKDGEEKICATALGTIMRSEAKFVDHGAPAAA